MIVQPGNSTPKQGIVADLTPLIDVLFMLIVFMVLTANTAQFAIDAILPSTEESGLNVPESDAPLIVLIRSSGAVFQIDGEDAVDWDAAKSIFLDRHQANEERSISVIVEPESQAQSILDVMAFLQVNNIESAQIIAEAR